MKKYKSGLTLLELAIVIGIIGLLVSMIISSFGKVGGSEALDTTTMTVISVLNEAKSEAISSKDASSYGVRILPNQLISFEGTSSPGINSKTITISNLVVLSTSTGIGNDVVFNNVTARTSASGTITITVLNDSTKKSTIRIYSTGVIEKN